MLAGGCADATHSQGDWRRFVEGDPRLVSGEESTPERRGANLWQESVRPKGGGVYSAARSNVDRKANGNGAECSESFMPVCLGVAEVAQRQEDV